MGHLWFEDRLQELNSDFAKICISPKPSGAPMGLVQVKAHDIRAFATSKAFYGGVSVDQIMQACHWKAHNTFTNVYLKDLTWSDNDNNMYLGPVVAAQQVLDPCPQTTHPRKEKKGGHIRCSQVFRSLNLRV